MTRYGDVVQEEAERSLWKDLETEIVSAENCKLPIVTRQRREGRDAG